MLVALCSDKDFCKESWARLDCDRDLVTAGMILMEY